MRGILIDAARDAFIELGYHGASLRQIALRAGTTQAILYRYFPSKAILFEASVLQPFDDFVSDLVENWRSASIERLSTEDLIGGFTRDLYHFTATHRGLMIALLAADAHGDEELAHVRDTFRHTLERVMSQVKADQDARGWSDIDSDIAAPVTMAMIISSALLDDWLFPSGAEHPTTERLLTELTRYEVRAITGKHIKRSSPD
jgi:AcrR family transcriptional regulator